MSPASQLTTTNTHPRNTETPNLDPGLGKLIEALAREAARRDHASLPTNASDESETAR